MTSLPIAHAAHPLLGTEVAWMIYGGALPALAARMRSGLPPVLPEPKADASTNDEYCCGAGGLSMVGPVAVVDVTGPIMASFSRRMAEYCGCTSMDAAVQTVRRVADDANVGGVVFRFNSPGGSVAGSEELIAAIAACAAKKPTAALVQNMACSLAAFAAAACGQIVAAQNAVVGSIGGIIDLYDWSKYYAEEGVESVAITDQPFKALGIPGQPVTPEMRANLLQLVRDQIAPYMRDFAARRGMSGEDVQAMQGRVYAAKSALALKLIDRVVTPREFVAEFSAAVARNASITAIDLPAPGGEDGSESGPETREGASMSTDFASMAAGLKPDQIDTATKAVTANAALFAAVGAAYVAANQLVPSAKAATIPELKAEFKDNPSFVLDAAERGLTMSAAKAEFATTLRGQLDQANAKIAQLQAELASKASVAPLGNPPVLSQDRPDPAAPQATGRFETRIKEHIKAFGGTETTAISALLAKAKADPAIKAEFDEYSAKCSAAAAAKR